MRGLKDFKAPESYLGEETSFEGRLDFRGAVMIAGQFKGEIRTPDLLIVKEGARIEGQIEVGTAVIQGEVVGQVRASERVELRPGAKIKGDILTPILVVQEGAMFNGRCFMDLAGAED